nr:sialic acid-binding Ig-like lectin 15 [Loxodonta africana]
MNNSFLKSSQLSQERIPHPPCPLPCLLSWKIIRAVPLLVFHMTKPHGSHLIRPLAAWLPLPSVFSFRRAQRALQTWAHCPPPPTFVPPHPHPHQRESHRWPGPVWGCPRVPGCSGSMEGPIQLLVCLACIIPMGSCVETKRDTTGNPLNTEVHTPPRIINISVLPGPTHTFHALCTAEGEPPPALVWSGPALGNSSATVPVPAHGHQVTAELPELAHDGRYTCTAANSLGRAEASVYLFRFRGTSGASALALPLGALGLKALLLLGVLAARAARHRPGVCALAGSGVVGQAGTYLLCQVVHQLSPVHRPQAQESNYENLNQMSPRSPPAAVCSPCSP